MADRAKRPVYDDLIEKALARIQSLLHGSYLISRRAIAVSLLCEDGEIADVVKNQDAAAYTSIQEIVNGTKAAYSQPLSYVIAMRRQHEARRIMAATGTSRARPREGFAEALSRRMMSPVTGIPILLIILFVGLYLFVGYLGAQILVNLIEGTAFGEWINPGITEIVRDVIPSETWQDLFVGEYGIFTLGLTYAIAIILPIVGTFFIAFSIIEDTGYLPRLAMLVDRLFKAVGLSGRAVIPMVLGLGCDTMATIVTRTQETKRERVITTLLLALAIPCSAQLGVIIAILSGNPAALLIWAGVLFLVLLLVGHLASRVLPGERASFYMEVPPLRLPKVSNVLAKTYTRMQWYLIEVLPIFVLISILMWIAEVAGLFGPVIRGIEPLVRFIGLPEETATVFLLGFFRRDFGAAGLYDLNNAGALSGISLVVSAVTLTLFIPCIAQFSVMIKERGIKTALAIALFILPFAFLVGFALNSILKALGVSL